MNAFIEYVLLELKNSFRIAFFIAIAALAILIVIYALYTQKNKGARKFAWAKALLWIAFVSYMAIVAYATLLRGNDTYRAWNIHLFRAWRECWNNYSAQNWANVLLNIAMFIPLGLLLPLLNNRFRKWYLTIPVGIGTSLLIELIQLATGIGICDVDDLFTNTLGTVIGFWLIMAILAAFKEKRHRLKTFLLYSSLILAMLAPICGTFVAYELKEYGNLPMAPAYRNNTINTKWTLNCELPTIDGKLPVYRTKNRSRQDCDTFAEYIAELDNSAIDMISYYQDYAYYMLHTEGSSSGVLLVSYYDGSYEYTTAGSRYDMFTVTSDRKTIEAALSKYSIFIPECADFFIDESNWHIFTVSQYIDGSVMFDGYLRCQYWNDGTLKKIENKLMSYSYYGKESVISPEDAYQALCNGDFYDEGYFEDKSPENVSVQSCSLGYEIDTKGFYQPVYFFEVESDDENYRDTIMIPAMKGLL